MRCNACVLDNPRLLLKPILPAVLSNRATCRRRFFACHMLPGCANTASHASPLATHHRCWPPTFGMAQQLVRDGVPLWAFLLHEDSLSPEPSLAACNPVVDMAWLGRSWSDARSLVSDRGTAMRSSHVSTSTVILIRTTDNANRYGPDRDEAFRPSVGRRDLMAPDWLPQGAFIPSASGLSRRRWRLRRTASEVSVEILLH